MLEFIVRATCDYCGEHAEGGGFTAGLMAEVLEFLRRPGSGWTIPLEPGDPVVCPMCRVRASLTVLEGGR